MSQEKDSKYRVLWVVTHPTQYGSPLFRMTAQHPRLELLVAYCSLQGAEPGMDPEFGREVAWDVPLLDGYQWVHVPNRSSRPGLGKFWGLRNPGLWKLIRVGAFDAVVLSTGYMYASFWIALSAAKFSRSPVLFGTDSHELRSRDNRSWKSRLKKILWPLLFRIPEVVIVPSSGSVALMRSLGVPEDSTVMIPYVVDNEWWTQRARRVSRPAVRSEWGVPPDAPVVLFCAKLQPWKRPGDLLRAMAKANVPEMYLVFAGDGPLLSQLEAEARILGCAQRVRFLGFVNQSQLPAVYCASDLLVLPSEYEPFGLVVNEAMLCGCPVAVSDRVGARFDLVRPGETGLVFPYGDVQTLASIFEDVLPDLERLHRLGQNARALMETWSPRQSIEAFVYAIEKATSLKPRRGKEGAGRGNASIGCGPG